jgi:hypothetical protein
MTVADLIWELEQMNPEAEVRFASQPNWPFEYSIASVVSVEVEDRIREAPVETVYLEEGRQLGYLPGEAKEELGW